ncbi:MAG: hypothetical protein LC772_03405, partial [Chloroflexi bacterium]|nr:hypothetical protein [Chloroflexota bacterium]
MKGPVMVLPALALCLAVGLALPGAARAQTWTALANQPGFTYGAGAALLLTDGTVIVHDEGSGTSQLGSDWKRLTPDASGSYTNGTWSSAGSLQAGYGPHYFASAVLGDGRVVIFGGEYNLADNSGNAVESNQGALYNPATNSWSALAGPGWANIGDAQCAVLPDGRLMMGFLFGKLTSVMDPTTLNWTAVNPPPASPKADNNSEEGWS